MTVTDLIVFWLMKDVFCATSYRFCSLQQGKYKAILVLFKQGTYFLDVQKPKHQVKQLPGQFVIDMHVHDPFL